jgi:ATP-dependent DNA ligase
VAGFIKPMLAKPMTDRVRVADEWYAEEKFDGHRLIVAVDDYPSDLFGERSVTAWSRDGKVRLLPGQVMVCLRMLPRGVYDGELHVPGGRSYGVTELVNVEHLVYTVFDVLEVLGQELMRSPYTERRRYLDEIFTRCWDPNHNGDEKGQANDRGCGNPDCFKFTGQARAQALRLSETTLLRDRAHIDELAAQVWARDGEGLILKRGHAPYRPGARSPDWVKVKKLQTAVLEVIGFEPGKGQVIDTGPCGIVVLKDPEGNVTRVKTKNYEWLGKLEAGQALYLGRKLRIEFQERTPDGSYRHPRWDRWEDE